jgi:hypothetical protein
MLPSFFALTRRERFTVKEYPEIVREKNCTFRSSE